MINMLVGLITLPFVLLADALTSGSSNDRSSGGDGGYDQSSGSDAYSGRWTQNEINVRDNIDAGMACKED